MHMKIFEIKSEKNTSPQWTLTAVKPAKHGLKRIRIEQDIPNFHLEKKQAHRAIDGIDRDFLFRNARHLHPLMARI